MTPEQCRDLAEYHKHMAEWCLEWAEKDTSMFGTTWRQAQLQHIESARYWREKADG